MKYAPFKRILGIAASLLLIPLGAFSQSPTTINFGSLPSGTQVTTQYSAQGLSVATETANGTLGIPETLSYPPSSGAPHTGLTNSATGTYPTTEFLNLNFSSPATVLSFTYNNRSNNSLSYYDAFSPNGALLGTGELYTFSAGGTVVLNLGDVSKLQLSNGEPLGSNWIFNVGSITFTEISALPAAYWHGQNGDGLWTSANWASDAAGTATALLPSSVTDVTFSATGAAHENTVLGADFTIKSLTIDDPAPVTISGNNILTIGGTSGVTGITVNAGAGAFTINCNLVLAGASQTVTVNNAAGMFVNGSIGGTVGLDKEGFGALTLSGNNSYTGTTTLDAGVLVVNNPHALGTGNVVVNGGLLLADPQPINVFGNYTQGPGGALLLHIGGAGAGQSDFLNVTGHAFLGGTLVLQSINGYQLKAGDQLTILIARGGFSGQFASVNAGTILFPEIIYEHNALLLELPPALSHLTPGQFAVEQELERVAFDPREAGLINVLQNQPVGNLPADFELIAPAELSALYEISFAAANVQQSNLEDRMQDVRNGATGFNSSLFVAGNTEITRGSDGKNVLDTSKDKNPYSAPIPAESPWGVFISGNGDFVTVDGDNNAKGYDFTTGGVTVGVDYRVNKHFAIGAAVDYAHTWTSLTGSGRIDADSGRGGVYGTFFDGGLYVNGYAGGGYNNYDTQRAALLGTARCSTAGGEFSTFLGSGYDLHRGGLTFGPVASLEYTYVGIDRFSESGSLAPLSFPAQSQDSLGTNLGMKVSYPWKFGRVVVTPQGSASWQHEFAYSALPVEARFANGAGDLFTVWGPHIGRDSALVEAGLTVQWCLRVATYLNYDGKFSNSYQSNTVNGGCRVDF